MRFVTLGVGAQRSPAFAPAGLLVSHAGQRVMIDGGPDSEPPDPIDAWLVSDEHSELQPELRRLARKRGLVPLVSIFRGKGLVVRPRAVVHTNHPSFGYLIELPGLKVVWAPEFFRFPRWAAGADLMFAEAASWARPIRFAGGVGGHMPLLRVVAAAQRAHVQRLVFAHIGRPTLRAMESGLRPSFGEFARDRQVFSVRPRSRGGGRHRRASAR
jgi:hypothetical protein